MREIKVKFFYTDGKDWIAKVFTLEEIMNGWPVEVISDQHFLRNYKMVDRVQYTGLKDANGVDIYEGDILAKYYDYFGKERSYTTGPVTWSEYDASVQGSICDVPLVGFNTDGQPLLLDEKYKVIGNIHENKELLS